MGKNKNLGEKPRVIIGMPATETMKAKSAHAIGCLAIESGDLVVDFLMMQSCDIASARTWLVKQARAKGATHLLFVDSDMLFPPSALKDLLARKKEIIGVEYNKRKFPLETVTAYLDGYAKSETEPYRVKVAGTGLMLIDLSIFDDPKMGKNWFSFGRNAEGENVLGEDGFFCLTAQSAGHEVWVDGSLKVLHLGEFGF